MEKVLVVEDDETVKDLILYTLESGGFDVLTARSLEEAKELTGDFSISLVLLDLNLPDGDGLTLIDLFCSKSIPVIILTARASVIDKVKGLNKGADDYIVKPFDTLELLARVKAILRRSSPPVITYTIGANSINLKERKLFNSSKEIYLTMKEWELLEYFLNNRGSVLSREVLLNRVWGQDFYGSTRTVDVHIQKLRSKVGEEHFSTVFKQGYRMEH